MDKYKLISLLIAMLIISGVLWLAVSNKLNSPMPTPLPESSAEKIQSVQYYCQKGKNALDLLEASFSAQTKDDSFGKMVVGINGIQPKSKQFWAFYVDEKQATVGAQVYLCQGSEKVEWKLESY